MTGHDYEYVVADYLRRRGYHGVKVTKGSGDFGVDVIASKHGTKYAVQCKLYSSPVGLSAIQEVVAGKACYGCTGAMVVTNSTFTAAAEDLAKRNGVILLDGVSPSAGRRPITIGKVLLYLLWLGVVGGIISEVLIPASPTGDVPGFAIILLLSLPFWIRPLVRLLGKGIKAIRNKASSRKAPATPVPTAPIVRDAPVTHTHSPEEIAEAAKSLVKWKYDSTLPNVADPELVASAIALAVENRYCTVSLIQRRLKLGYQRASQVVDALENLGIVGPYEGEKPRAVLLTTEELISQKI